MQKDKNSSEKYALLSSLHCSTVSRLCFGTEAEAVKEIKLVIVSRDKITENFAGTDLSYQAQLVDYINERYK